MDSSAVLDESNALTIEECDFHLRVIRGLLHSETDELALEVLHERANRVLERRTQLHKRLAQKQLEDRP